VVWLLGPGQYWAARHYQSLRCALTERSLVVERGFLFTVQKTIPLQRIQDLTVRGGPLLRAMGLEMMSVETAGQSNPQGGADARLLGVVDLRSFRQQVLEQCRVVDVGAVSPSASAPVEGAAPARGGGELVILEEIRDTLQRIEGRLAGRSSDS
jgi:putative membrane protein